MRQWAYILLTIGLDALTFDVPRLLSLPSFSDAGPNLHSFSLVTWLTAVVYSIFGYSKHVYLLLHLVHMAIATAGLLVLYHLVRPVLTLRVSLLAVLLVGMWPLVLRQFGKIYLETALFTLTVVVLFAVVRAKWQLAAMSLLLAVGVKLSDSSSLRL